MFVCERCVSQQQLIDTALEPAATNSRRRLERKIWKYSTQGDVNVSAQVRRIGESVDLIEFSAEETVAKTRRVARSEQFTFAEPPVDEANDPARCGPRRFQESARTDPQSR